MGPLKGYKVVEIAGIGPCPIAGMILADLGAEVILVERLSSNPNAAVVGKHTEAAFFKRGKRSISLDLKKPDSVETVLMLIQESDAFCDGTLYNQTLLASVRAEGAIGEEPGETFFRAGSHWCNTYLCSDERYITVQALEPNFYKELITLCGFFDDPDFARQHDTPSWPAAREKMAMMFSQKPQNHWCTLLEGTDACFAPVLTLQEAAQYPHIKARVCFLEGDELLQPAPAPRFSATPQQVGKVPRPGQHTKEVLESLKAKRV